MKAAILALLVAALTNATANATTFSIVVAGLGGEPDYEQRFNTWAQELDKTLRAAPESQVETLTGAKATKENLRAIIANITKSAKADDALMLVLIGHGTFDGTEYKMNLPGPDVTATDLATWLDRVPASRQLIVNATSASGASQHALVRENRTIITATKSGTEKNATVFPRYWVEALRDAAADTDKNEVISALEAFKFAELKTKQFYDTNKRLATEHALLNGGDSSAGLGAGRFALLRIGSIQMAASDPAKRALLEKREQIEGSIDRLKFQKAAMPTDQYKRELQVLLLELARTQAEIDK